MGGIRRAVVIGINKYQHEKIETLSGAVADATEVRAILTGAGQFIIDDAHFLIDEMATSEQIRMAISDLFWKTEECDVALFYFSGHGRRDHFGHGYLLSCDADYTAPFVKGIRIQELKELFLCAEPKTTGILVLDCCYSGIATKVDKGTDAAEHLESFREELRLTSDGSGRFILASADADKTAREATLEHSLGGETHVHGLFSFHLIEGLTVGPKDAGRISLGALVRHLENAFKAYPKHKPQLNVAGASGADYIFLTTAAEELQAYLQKCLYEVKDYIAQKTAMGLMMAIDILNGLEKKGIVCAEITQYYNNINDVINKSAQVALPWWIANNLGICRLTTKSEWYCFLDKTLNNFTVHNLRKFDSKQLSFLTSVMECIQEGDSKRVANLIRVLDRDSHAGVEREAISITQVLTPTGLGGN